MEFRDKPTRPSARRPATPTMWGLLRNHKELIINDLTDADRSEIFDLTYGFEPWMDTDRTRIGKGPAGLCESDGPIV